MQPIGYESAALNATFGALADPTRRAILARLSLGEASVQELAEPFHLTQPAISKHLKVLEKAGLIVRERAAQRRPSRLNAQPLAAAAAWIDAYRAFWETSFARLDQVLAELQSQPKAQLRSKPKARTRRSLK